MEANELRLDNIVTIDNKEYRPMETGLKMRVDSIDKRIIRNEKNEIEEMNSIGLYIIDEVPIYNKQLYQLLEYVRPILLTEEILLNCGFEWDVFDQAYTDGNYNIKKNKEYEGFSFFHYSDKHSPIHYEIIYLHQFQNLYFAITGKELQIEF